MKLEFNSRRLFGITRAKGKMYELGLPEDSHIAVPADSEPQELFIPTVGTLGDVAAELSDAADVRAPLPQFTAEELGFSASFFDAFLESKFSEDMARDTTLLAASAYYLANRPGSSLVLARRLSEIPSDSPVDKLLHLTLQARWSINPGDQHPVFGEALGNVARMLALHFDEGSHLEELTTLLTGLRRRAYEAATSRELLFIDIITAIIRMRLAASAWMTLPDFTGIGAERWAPTIRRPEFPKELWPSQLLLGRLGLFSGASAIVQMPTSAGKTRSVEIVLRSSFLAGRTMLAIVVAPFRALCHEIGTSLRHAFRNDAVKVNELSDAMQIDFLQEVAELFGSNLPTSQYILVLTPEKLLYILRQTPTLITDIGVVVYDEAHQFDSGHRGITYELLLTEIKALLPAEAQTILLSAVIQNAQAIGEWLLGDAVQVVNGSNLLPTARSVAFSSWSERLGQLMFFESGAYDKPSYFVPRVIEQQALERRPRERVNRHFPVKSDSSDIALYLGIRLVSEGAVAIFCGRKDSASAIASRAVEIYERGFSLGRPSAWANPDELRKLKNLIDSHFGERSIASRAASLGVFVHHGTTPQGLRLSIEYAMHHSMINFVVCTSTLAQGVNLPIRYLIVSSIHQAGEKLKVRDFQNLVGRAGRSGMHTEGLVIFSAPDVYDKRKQRRESWKFRSAVELLSPDNSGATSSSLLELIEPLRSSDRKSVLQLSTSDLCLLMLSDEGDWLSFAKDVVEANPQSRFEASALVAELRRRRRLIFALESYLMANRGSTTFDRFKAAAEQLASATLAYHLASDDQKAAVITLFNLVTEYLQQQQPTLEKQAAYAKTLLGVRTAEAVERWVIESRDLLLTLDSNENWLEIVWVLFSQLLDDKFFRTVKPESLAMQLAKLWLQGRPYEELFAHTSAGDGSKPWGEDNRRRLTEDNIVTFCEHTLGFECSLIISAVAQFLLGHSGQNDDRSAALLLFQKSLKYGLPDWPSISCYEHGFADRVVAQRLCEVARADGFSGKFFPASIESHRDRIESALKDYPSYFASVLAGRT